MSISRIANILENFDPIWMEIENELYDPSIPSIETLNPDEKHERSNSYSLLKGNIIRQIDKLDKLFLDELADDDFRMVVEKISEFMYQFFTITTMQFDFTNYKGEGKHIKFFSEIRPEIFEKMKARRLCLGIKAARFIVNTFDREQSLKHIHAPISKIRSGCLNLLPGSLPPPAPSSLAPLPNLNNQCEDPSCNLRNQTYNPQSMCSSSADIPKSILIPIPIRTLSENSGVHVPATVRVRPPEDPATEPSNKRQRLLYK